jgi:hypothetical protein
VNAHTLIDGTFWFKFWTVSSALVTNSTSWTPIEDFGILLAALVLLDKRIREQSPGWLGLLVANGKKALKGSLSTKKMSQLPLQHVAIQIVAGADRLQKFVGMCRLRVSLHTSTSGWIYQWKSRALISLVAGSYLCHAECLSELVDDDVNGRVFISSQLADQMYSLEPLAQSQLHGSHMFGRLGSTTREICKSEHGGATTGRNMHFYILLQPVLIVDDEVTCPYMSAHNSGCGCVYKLLMKTEIELL